MDANTGTADAASLIKRINGTEDFYRILNVDKDATTAQIKKEFRLLARVVHPDKCSVPGAEDAFKKVNAAHKCLSNEESRRHYDLTGGEMNEDGGQSPFGAGGADIFAEMFRNHAQAGGGDGGGGGNAGFRTINLNDLLPEKLQMVLKLPGVGPLLLIICGVLFFKVLAWLMSLSLYILAALYLTPAKVRWWLVLLILLLSLLGFI